MSWTNFDKDKNVWTIINNEQIFENNINDIKYSQFILVMLKLHYHNDIISNIYFKNNNFISRHTINSFIESLENMTEYKLEYITNVFFQYGTSNKIVYRNNINKIQFPGFYDEQYDNFKDNVSQAIKTLHQNNIGIVYYINYNTKLSYDTLLEYDNKYYFIDCTILSIIESSDEQVMNCIIYEDGFILESLTDIFLRYMHELSKENDLYDTKYKSNILLDSTTESINPFTYVRMDALSDISESDNENDDNQTIDSSVQYENDSCWITQDIIDITTSINQLDDILAIPKECKHPVMIKLLKLQSSILKLQNLIGLDDIKNILFEISILCALNPKSKLLPHQRLHTIIYGPPGTGKTTFAHILADLYCKMNFIKTNRVHCVKSNDLIGEYVGHTAPKVEKAVNKALGGVLLIDEAYTIGYYGSKGQTGSSFAQECLDALNRNLTEKGDQFICILAGYKNEIDNNVLSANPGLDRRFNFRFTMPELSSSQLFAILQKKFDERFIFDISQYNIDNFFKENPLAYQGGDIETLMVKLELVLYLKNFKNANFLINDYIEKITIEDVIIAYNECFKHRNKDNVFRYMDMYL